MIKYDHNHLNLECFDKVMIIFLTIFMIKLLKLLTNYYNAKQFQHKCS